MAEIPVETKEPHSRLEACIGISVVVLATFLGLCNVKANNIVQQMQVKQVDRNNSWAWYQARNIRAGVYEASGDELSVPYPNETADTKQAREAMATKYFKRAKDQESKMEKQKEDAEQAEADYEKLGQKDDQFDICEAALAIGLALMGVTAMLKRWWMFFFALVPSAFGVAMGVAGFMGMDTGSPVMKYLIGWLS